MCVKDFFLFESFFDGENRWTDNKHCNTFLKK